MEKFKSVGKTVEGSCIGDLIPCRQTMQKYCNEQYNPLDNFDPVLDGFMLKKERIKAMNERELYLWADGTFASQKKSLLVLLGQKNCTHSFLGGTICCSVCSINYQILYVGFSKEKDLTLVIPIIVDRLVENSNIKNLYVVADNSCLQILLSLKKDIVQRCGFCYQKFYTYLPKVNCFGKCSSGCSRNGCPCFKYYKNYSKYCSGECKCKCKSHSKCYQERKKKEIKKDLFDIENY